MQIPTPAALLITAAILTAPTAAAQRQNPRQSVAATPCYNIQIFETGDTLLTFDNPQHLRAQNATRQNRGFLDGLFKAMRQSYQSTLTGQVATTSASLLSSGIGIIADLFRSKRSDWATQTAKECQFQKKLTMSQEIHDFYGNTTTNGALDPDGMLFSGFGCTQYYIANGDTIPALYLRCNLRKDQQGKDRILHHGKFEVEVTQLYINPYICGLPNDSLQPDEAQLRIPFNFNRRKNLRLQITATITSSWVNQAIQMTTDQQLGQFTITLSLPDSTSLQKDGDFKDWYVFDTAKPQTSSKNRPQVTGESFIVPRSYIGTADGETFADVWGTGQYKIEMALAASCDINTDYYLDNDPSAANPPQGTPGMQGNRRWNHYWSEEWNMMKKRKKRGATTSILKQLVSEAAANYTNGPWVYTILEPAATYILTQESAYVNKAANKLFGLDPSAAASSAGAAPTSSAGASGAAGAASSQQSSAGAGQQSSAGAGAAASGAGAGAAGAKPVKP